MGGNADKLDEIQTSGRKYRQVGGNADKSDEIQTSGRKCRQVRQNTDKLDENFQQKTRPTNSETCLLNIIPSTLYGMYPLYQRAHMCEHRSNRVALESS